MKRLLAVTFGVFFVTAVWAQNYILMAQYPTPSLIPGNGISISGVWPNQVVSNIFVPVSGVWTVPQGGTGQSSFTANLPILGNGTGNLAQGTRSGNTTEFATANGAFTSGNCVTTDANGNFINGGVCAPGTVVYIPSTSCKGNDAVDDSTVINSAITTVYNAGGGVVQFSNGMDCRIQNPIILKAYVQLVGAGAIVNVSPGVGTVIRPAANIAALITQATLTNFIHSAGIWNLTLDGRAASYTVTNIVDVWWVNGRLINNYIANGTGNCINFLGSVASGANPDWVNWVKNNSVLECANTDLAFSGTDSIIEGNYVSGGLVNGSYGGLINSYGAVRIIGNQFEDISGGVGLLVLGPGAGCATTDNPTVIVGNNIEQNTTGLEFQLGACGSTETTDTTVSGNMFVANTTQDIYVDSGVQTGVIAGNSFSDSTPSNGHIAFNGTSNAGWVIGPNDYHSGTTQIVNMPTDAASQVFGANSQMSSVLLKSSTIANLGSCGSGNVGQTKWVIDTVASGAPVWHGNITGGGSTHIYSLGICNGSTWQYE